MKDLKNATVHLKIALGSNMNVSSLTPLAIIEIMEDYHQSQLKLLVISGVINSLKVGMQTFDLCDCPYQINTWIEKYNIQADNIISINQDGKQVVMFYKAFNDC